MVLAVLVAGAAQRKEKALRDQLNHAEEAIRRYGEPGRAAWAPRPLKYYQGVMRETARILQGAGTASAANDPARRIAAAQREKAALTTEIDRLDAGRGPFGVAVPSSHYLNAQKRLRTVKAEIRGLRGLQPIASYSGRPTAAEEATLHDDDAPHPIVEWGQQAWPPFLQFMRDFGTAMDDSAGVHTTEERQGASRRLPGGFRQGVSGPLLGLPKAAIRQTSDTISRTSGHGPIHPSVYTNDVASRVTDHAAEFAPYAFPVLGQGLAAVQGADLAASVMERGPVRAAAELYEGIAPWKAKTPEEAVLRTLGLLGGAAHVANMSPALRGRVMIVTEAMRKGAPPDPAQVARLVSDAHAEAKARGQGQMRREAPAPKAAPNMRPETGAGVTSDLLKRRGGAEAFKAGEEVERERARLRRDHPNAVIGMTGRDKAPLVVADLSDAQLARHREKAQAKRDAAVSSEPARIVARHAHNFDVLNAEHARRVASAPPPLRAHGSFDKLGIEEQSAAEAAARNPVRGTISSQSVPMPQMIAVAQHQLRVFGASNLKVVTPALGPGVEVGFGGMTWGKLYKGDGISQTIVPFIPDLLAKAKLVYVESPKRGDGSYQSAARLVARLDTNEGSFDVWMLVKLNKQGHIYYDHSHTVARPVVLPNKYPYGFKP